MYESDSWRFSSDPWESILTLQKNNDTVPTAYQKWRMCDRKKMYPTESKANKQAKKHGHRSYYCPICFCWHVTSKGVIK